MFFLINWWIYYLNWLREIYFKIQYHQSKQICSKLRKASHGLRITRDRKCVHLSTMHMHRVIRFDQSNFTIAKLGQEGRETFWAKMCEKYSLVILLYNWLYRLFELFIIKSLILGTKYGDLKICCSLFAQWCHLWFL